MWSEVEWSRSRRAWCIQDAAGRCLTHVEHILEQDRDVQTAIRLAKRMIRDGRMPTPEDAQAQLQGAAARAFRRAAGENRICKILCQSCGIPMLEKRNNTGRTP